MILRFEFPPNKSQNFARALGICRRLKSFKERTEDGMVLYSVEFTEDDIFSAEAIRDLIYGWKGAAYYVDGMLVSRSRIWRVIFEAAMEVQSRASRARRVEPDSSPPGPAGPTRSTRPRSIAGHVVPLESLRDPG